MIECIYIADTTKRVLFGSHPLLSQYGYYLDKESRDQQIIETAELACKREPNYPITYGDGVRMAHLRVNDVILNVLYRHEDNFQASKYLLDLKLYLEDKLVEINIENVTGNYFMLLDILQTPDFISKPSKFVLKEHVFVDIVENIHCTVIGDCVVSNSSHGEVFLDQNPSGTVAVTLEKSEPLMLKSIYRLTESENKATLSCVDPESRSLLSFFRRESPVVYFRMKRTVNLITFESEYLGEYRFIEFIIPVGMNAYQVDSSVSGGECEFNLKTGKVHWRFKDTQFKKATVKLNVSSIEEESITEPITVNFRIENSENCALQLTKAENAGFPEQKFWVRSTIQSGHYELNSR